VIRTTGNPLKSLPSRPLMVTTSLIVAIGTLLPFTGLAGPLGFVPLTAAYFAYLAVATAVYLVLVEFGKRVLFGRAAEP